MSSRVPFRAPWVTGGALLLMSAGCTAVALLGCRPKPAPASLPPLPTIRTVTAAERETFVGSEACESCHRDVFRLHQQSQHASAVTRVDADGHGERFRRPSTTQDPNRGLNYETTVIGDRCVLVTRQGNVETITPAHFGFGSGKHAITYMSAAGPDLLELRLSYYSEAKRWDFSPGQQLKSHSGGVVYPQGLVKGPDVVEGCFICHSTAVVKEGGKVRPESTLLGVGCESCHGAGRDHIAAAKRGDKDLRMVRLSEQHARISQALCGQCHRSPVSEDLHDPFNQTQLPRLQGLALSQSPCFTNSGGRLSCLTCHSPHGDAEQTRAGYNRACTSCHTGSSPDQRQCSLAPTGDCVSCHMPAQPVGMPTGLKYRTHWIKVWGVR